MTARPQNVPISSAGEAEREIANLDAIIDRLAETIVEETAHVRAGRLRAAAELDRKKTELVNRYAAESGRVKGALNLIARSLPQLFERLRNRHTALEALLQTNLTVLATAHAVSEGIIRGVSGELARKRVPASYGPKGRANGPGAKASQPLALSRTL